jgi:microcystin-dependent protein
MSDPFVGQVIAVGFNFAPVGWQLCDGSLLQIAQNPALFSLLGTTFGGDGQNSFGVPDLRGRVVVGAGQGPGLQPYVLGEIAGVESVALISNQFASHTHGLQAAATATPMYASAGTAVGLAGSTVTPSPGQGTAHENRQPSTTVNYIISLYGVYPSQ